MHACIREDYVEYEFTRTLSNDRHPAGRHSVFDGMMEVFGDWISKISQIDRWRLKLRSCCDQCLSNFLATKSPLKESRKNIRLFNRNLRVTKEHQRASRSNSWIVFNFVKNSQNLVKPQNFLLRKHHTEQELPERFVNASNPERSRFYNSNFEFTCFDYRIQSIM